MATSREQQLALETTRYHEAGHAVLMWNFDLPVLLVVVNRSDASGYVRPGPDRQGTYTVSWRIAEIFAHLGGGMAHRCMLAGAEKTRNHCSQPDIKLALNVIMTLGDLPPGAEVCLLRELLLRTRDLMDVPEVQSQVRALAERLIPTGCLLPRQVHVLLKGMPESRSARNQCRQAVAQVEAALPDLLVQATQQLTPSIQNFLQPCPAHTTRTENGRLDVAVNGKTILIKQTAKIMPEPG